MIREGVLDNPKVDVVFGLHINSATEVGKIKYRSEGAMAASDWFTLKVKGKGSHGSQPWAGVDPIVVSAQIIEGLQTIIMPADRADEGCGRDLRVYIQGRGAIQYYPGRGGNDRNYPHAGHCHAAGDP